MPGLTLAIALIHMMGGMFSHKHHVGHVSRLSVTATFIDIATVEAMLSFFYIVRLQMLGQQSARHV